MVVISIDEDVDIVAVTVPVVVMVVAVVGSAKQNQIWLFIEWICDQIFSKSECLSYKDINIYVYV